MAGALQGRVALVTGASSGIGEAAALALAAEGASVAVSGRRAERLEALVARIASAGGTALALPGDVTVEAVARGTVAKTVEAFGRIDILVNSAGMVQPGNVGEADIAEWRRVMDLNLFAILITCNAALPHMRAQGGGDIVNIASLAARKVNAAFNLYSTSKHALRAMNDGLRQEVGGEGIRVCLVLPGATATECAEAISDPQARDAMRHHVGKEGVLMPEDVAETILLAVSLPRRANVSELAVRPTIDVTA